MLNKAPWLFFSLCCLAALAPFRSARSNEKFFGPAFPGWRAAPLPPDLAPVPLGERERRFTADFPGKVGAFTDGRKTFVVRWLVQPTRKLHPASDCLHALGFHTKPLPIFLAPDHTTWGAQSAARENEHTRVLERICDEHGKSWTDVSSWYWSALWGKTSPPWWTVTILESEN